MGEISVKIPQFSAAVSALIIVSIFLSMSAYGFAWRAGRNDCRAGNICSAITNDHSLPGARLLRVQSPGALPPNIGRWQLVRTPGPERVGETVSIMHTADALKSDPDFVGMMIRCREKSALQIGFIVIRPFPPRTHPRVSISTGRSKIHLQASIVPPGNMVSLPDEAQVLAKGAWQSVNQMAVAIEGDGVKIHGVVPLENLAKAIALLQANCPEH